uniref:Transmembrane protein 230 n=1 Tax=Steinernema glaseri TaxID=37863 RepID=A0A1I7Y3Z5_9BILA
MVRKKNPNLRHRKLPTLPPDDPDDTPKEDGFPWRGLIFAIALCSIGFLLLVISVLTASGYSDKYYDRLWPMTTLGAVMFLPGFYHVRIAFYAYLGKPGYSFDDLPNFE